MTEPIERLAGGAAVVAVEPHSAAGGGVRSANSDDRLAVGCPGRLDDETCAARHDRWHAAVADVGDASPVLIALSTHRERHEKRSGSSETKATLVPSGDHVRSAGTTSGVATSTLERAGAGIEDRGH
jgi:hypothetical protein